MYEKIDGMLHVPESLKILIFLWKYFFFLWICSRSNHPEMYCFAYIFYFYFFTYILVIHGSKHQNLQVQHCLRIFWLQYQYCLFDEPDIFCSWHSIPIAASYSCLEAMLKLSPKTTPKSLGSRADVWCSLEGVYCFPWMQDVITWCFFQLQG